MQVFPCVLVLIVKNDLCNPHWDRFVSSSTNYGGIKVMLHAKNRAISVSGTRDRSSWLPYFMLMVTTPQVRKQQFLFLKYECGPRHSRAVMFTFLSAVGRFNFAISLSFPLFTFGAVESKGLRQPIDGCPFVKDFLLADSLVWKGAALPTKYKKDISFTKRHVSFISTLVLEFPLMNSQSTFSFLGKKQFIMTGKLCHQILSLPDGFKLSST